ncbi:MAG: lysophospholipid acyltransferase family protein [Pseudomonadota bacterium]
MRLRSFAFFIVLALSLLVYAPLVALLFPLPFHVAHRASNVWTRFFVWFSRTIGGVDCRIDGIERLPGGPCIFFSKHQSAWETLAFQALLPPYVWILKREALWIPFFGWGLSALRPIAIDRSARGAAVRQIRDQGIERLDAGLSVLIFPESTRMPPGKTRRFGLGGAVLATESGYPVVPIAHNSGSFWPARRLLIERAGTVDIVIGEPINPTGLTPEALNERVKGWIDATVADLEERARAKATNA